MRISDGKQEGRLMKIHFLPEGLDYSFETGKSILQLASEAGIAIDGNCAGKGTCGKCKIKVITGNDRELSKEEITILTNNEIRDGYRLACKFKPMNDVAVEVPLADDVTNRKTKLAIMPNGFIVGNRFRKEHKSIEASTIKDQMADLEKIKKICGLERSASINIELMKKIPDLLAEKREMTVTIRDDKIIDLESGDTGNACYGLALDIGTTTVVGHLWDLITGDLIGVRAVTNPQGSYGADVISRITYANESKENLADIHQKIIECINGIASWFSETYQIRPNQIYDITVVGNTTMSHLFLGINPRQLAISPFAPVFVKNVTGVSF